MSFIKKNGLLLVGLAVLMSIALHQYSINASMLTIQASTPSSQNGDVVRTWR